MSSHKEPSIRQLTEADWAVWKEIRLEALQAHPEAFCGAYEDESTWTEEAFRKYMMTNDIFGAFVQGDLVGCIGFYIHSGLKMRHRGTLFTLYLRPNSRGQGIGNLLVKQVIEHAKDKVMQLHCGVVTGNQAGINLYEKHGFVRYGTDPRFIKVKNKYYDLHILFLTLH